MKPTSSPAALGPFLTPVRRRHPDVDVVVLPPPAPPPGDPDPVGEADVDEQRARVTRLAARWWRSVEPAAGPPEQRVRFGPAPGTVVASARHRARVETGAVLLAGIAAAVQRDGGHVRRTRTGMDRVAGELDGVRVRASYAEQTGAVLLEVESEPMFVGRRRARELVGG